jgi:hypothetical protein
LLPAIETRVLNQIDPIDIVTLLENCGGDVMKFVKNVDAAGIPPEFIIYHAEKILSDYHDKALYKRWNDSIRLRKKARWRITQEKVFDALEQAAIDPSANNKNVLDMSKVVLQEFLVAEVTTSKNALSAKEPEKDDEAAFEADLAEMEELG